MALRSKQLIYYSLLVGLSGVVAYCYSAAAPLISASFLRLNPAQYGLWNFLNIIGMFASGIFAAKLIKHYAMKKIIQYFLI